MLARTLIALALIALVYLVAWPIAVEPRSWQPPKDRGYQGAFAENARLTGLKRVPLDGHGPETLAVSPEGLLIAGLDDGRLVQLDAEHGSVTIAQTGGRPLGLAFDGQEWLYIADAELGLIRLPWPLPGPGGTARPELVLDHALGKALGFTNSLAIAADGTLYFTDASTRHPARQHGTYPASLRDINEHGGAGRVLAYHPDWDTPRLLARGFNFANGLALTADDSALLVAETGHYRVHKVFLTGPRAGERALLLNNLPGFPDNLSRAPDGTFWLGLVSPRDPILDALAPYPALRKLVERLPTWLKPRGQRYGHVIGFDAQGRVRHNLQDPDGHYAFITGAVVRGEHLYLSSLFEPAVAFLPYPVPPPIPLR